MRTYLGKACTDFRRRRRQEFPVSARDNSDCAIAALDVGRNSVNS
jgi:hypothetical protein